jgi:hypothetical protein
MTAFMLFVLCLRVVPTTAVRVWSHVGCWDPHVRIILHSTNAGGHCPTVHGPAHKCVGVGRQLETGVSSFAGAWLSPEPASQQATPKASLTWPCGGVRSEALHHTGRCLSGCTALLPDLLRGGIRLLDSALVTCSLQKKKKKKKKLHPGVCVCELGMV